MFWPQYFPKEHINAASVSVALQLKLTDVFLLCCKYHLEYQHLTNQERRDAVFKSHVTLHYIFKE